jgi:hypothetical protein
VARGTGSSQRRRRATFVLAAVALIALSASACTAAISPSPQRSASAAASASPSASTSGLIGTAAPSQTVSGTGITVELATETPTTETPYVDPNATPTPPFPKGPMPSVGPVPIGDWTGIKWIALPRGNYPVPPASNEAEDGANATLEGWSKGYVEFIWNPHTRTLMPWTSADGLTWRSGTQLDLRVWTAEFKAFDAEDPGAATEPDYHDACAFQADGFQEGPASMLLRGFFVCGGSCGGPWYTSADAIWVSADSLSWTPLDIAKTFGTGGAPTISGGSAGYVALGSGASGPSIWTSSDGLAWTSGSLPPAVLTAGSSVDSPVSFAGGFVLPSVVVEKRGHKTSGRGIGGCMAGLGPTDLSLYQSVLWWSPDGKTWSRDALHGTTSSYNGVSMSLIRIDDHTVVADELISNTEIEWASTDGKTWTGLKAAPIGRNCVIVGRVRGLIEDCSTQDVTSLLVLNNKLALVTLKQTGDLPWWDGSQLVLGPTGVLATDDGTRFWIGLPSTG